MKKSNDGEEKEILNDLHEALDSNTDCISSKVSKLFDNLEVEEQLQSESADNKTALMEILEEHADDEGNISRDDFEDLVISILEYCEKIR
jgi:hypothetical protein